MKKLFLLLTGYLLFLVSTQAQMFTLSFSGNGTCPTQNNTGLQISNSSVSPLTRNGTGLACVVANDAFNSSGWTSGTAIDATQYIEFSITANANYILKMTQISFAVTRSSTGPVNGRIAHDGGTGTFSNTFDYSVTTNSNTITWDFADFYSISGGTVKFRLYGWNGNASGTLRFTNIAPYGSSIASPLVIDYATGNVGVATPSAPSQKLEVNGNVLVKNGRVIIGNIDTNSMRTNNYALGVNGIAIVNKLIVKKNTGAAWPDYVFGEGYKPISLDSLQTFIKSQRHLPDMPSSAEVEAGGIDVSTSQSALLKKIEELTLYILAQNKLIAEQNKEQQAHAAEIKKLTQDMKILKASLSHSKSKSK